MNRFITALAVTLIGLSGGWVATTAYAAEDDPEDCPPIVIVDEEAWTEIIEHPAVTHEETVPGAWWNFSPNHQQGPFEGPPSFPTDERGEWQGPHKEGGPSQELTGTFQQGNGHGSWFHREEPTVVTVIDEEAWTETIEHPAVTHEEPGDCDDPTDPPTDEPTDPPTDDPTDPPTDEPTTPTDEPTPDEPTDEPGQPTVTRECFGNSLSIKRYDAEGNQTYSASIAGHPSCASEPGVKEEGM